MTPEQLREIAEQFEARGLFALMREVERRTRAECAENFQFMGYTPEELTCIIGEWKDAISR